MAKSATAPTTPAPAAASQPVITQPKATPAPAAAPKVDANVVELPKTPDAAKSGTTDRLFPDWKPAGKPSPALDGVDATPTPPSDSTSQTPAFSAPDVLDLESIKGKQLKLIVDGKEEVVSVEEALKGLQLERHLTQKSQSMEKRERELADREKSVRQQLELLIPQLPKPGEPTPRPSDPSKDSLFSDDPLIRSLMERIKQVEDLNADLVKTTAKTRYNENLQRLADYVKAEHGFEDFMAYRPRLEEVFKAIPVDKRASSDTAEWWTSQFLSMKSKDLHAELSKSKSAPPAPTPPAPPARPAAGPVLGIGGSGGSPSAPPVADDWDNRYREAFSRAQSSGATEDWIDVLKIKEEAKTRK